MTMTLPAVPFPPAAPLTVAVGATVSLVHEALEAPPTSCQFPAVSLPITQTSIAPSALALISSVMWVATAIAEL